MVDQVKLSDLLYITQPASQCLQRSDIHNQFRIVGIIGKYLPMIKSTVVQRGIGIGGMVA